MQDSSDFKISSRGPDHIGVDVGPPFLQQRLAQRTFFQVGAFVLRERHGVDQVMEQRHL
jgi:hypothetical protein